jgi:hypothetical protein
MTPTLADSRVTPTLTRVVKFGMTALKARPGTRGKSISSLFLSAWIRVRRQRGK